MEMMRLTPRGSFSLFVALVLAVFTLGLAACGGDDAAEAEPAPAPAEPAGRVAIIDVVPIASSNWDISGFAAFTKMAEKYNLEVSNQEGVAYDEAAAVLRRLAPDNDMIIAHSSGYGAAVLETAPDFPDTWFVVFSDLATTNDLPNVAAWAVNWNELGYMEGTVACLAAIEQGSPSVGHVNSAPIPAFTRLGGGAKDGAEAAGCEYATNWTGSLSDVALAKQAALALIDGGAGALVSSAAAADAGSRDAAVEENTLLVTHYTPAEVELAPEQTITVVLLNFDQAYDEMGQLLTSGQLEAKIYPVNVQNDGIFYLTPFQHVDPSVEEKASEIYEQIKGGEIVIDPSHETAP